MLTLTCQVALDTTPVVPVSAEESVRVPIVATLDDAIKTLSKLAETLPAELADLRSEVILEERDGTAVAASLETDFPELSKIYLEVVKRFRLAGVSIGLFNLAPSNGELVEAIRSANSNPKLNETVVVVANHHGDEICLDRRGGSDRVMLISHESGQASLLADDFEQLLILASTTVAATVSGFGASAAYASLDVLLEGRESMLSLWRSLFRQAGHVDTR